MADSSNTFSSLQPMLKETYAAGHEKPGENSGAYSDKLQKILSKPNNSKKYFAHIKKYLKKAKGK